MLLLSGPPGCGNSRQILEQIRNALRRGAEDFRLIVPASSMAWRVRDRLAREGLFLRPGVVLTLPEFIRTWVKDLAEASPATLHILVLAALRRASRREFEAAADSPGLARVLVDMIREVSTAGCDARRLARLLEVHSPDAPFARAFAAVYRELERELNRRGLGLPGPRLAKAEEEIRDRGLGASRRILLDGFPTFSDTELGLIDALREHADVTAALPAWPGSEAARAALLRMGFTESTSPAAARPTSQVVAASNLEEEAEEVARRIVEEAAGGRPFREMAILLRDEETYLPLMRAVLKRHGIPARFHFPVPLAGRSTVRYLAGLAEAALGEWDHEQALVLLKMAPSGVASTEACDRFDFMVRARLPGRGLAGLRELADDPRLLVLLDRWSTLDSWRAFRLPPHGWAARAKTLRAFVRPPPIADRCPHELAILWRSHAAALDAFDAAMEETAEALPEDGAVSFSEFWRAARVVLAETPFHVRDLRRNAVHVLDASDPPDCEFPAVFLCGLAESRFPRRHLEDEVLPDAARRLLRRAGLRLPTAADRRRREDFLFAQASARATSKLVLTYAESGQDGVPNLPSAWIRQKAASKPEKRGRAVQSGRRVVCAASPAISAPDLLDRIRACHARLAPGALGDFLRCPFHFFAARTLSLEGPPPRPDQRLDGLPQDELIRGAIREWQRDSKPLEALFEAAFREACAAMRIPGDCRTERVRLEMLRDLRRFAAASPLFEGWTLETGDTTPLRCVYVGPRGAVPMPPDRNCRAQAVLAEPRAIIVDFRYATSEMRRAPEDDIEGAIHLLALEDQSGYRPAGWFCCALRGGPSLRGWHVPAAGLERTGEARSEEEFRRILEHARSVALQASREISAGRIEPSPSGAFICAACRWGDVCRSRGATRLLAASGAAG